ncbi:hypothetical protein B0A49_13141 [Cryomyces minteri]|uniref:Uncharacterized protein n=1 Tax=Cryomyces minteri TaxID=331657 RepID=A0A4U0VLD4_9PEZI|nr:hypothetical protein B0A49_13141 [Cryomyces minteri]
MFGIIEAMKNPAKAGAILKVPDALGGHVGRLLPDVVKPIKSGKFRIKFAGAKKTTTINPNANVFNRPESAVVPRDDFLGPRPDVDTEADLRLLIEECRGTYSEVERAKNIFDCLRFLAEGEGRYYTLPERVDRASEQDPRAAEYAHADGLDDTRNNYVDIASARPASTSSLGSCPGPIIPYHVYWTGPATWRVEIFIKSYLYTQNLACSRLWIWLDSDRNPSAVEDMTTKDPLFARFLPLVNRGDINLKAWHFPSRIPLPKAEDNTDGVGYHKNPGQPNFKGETAVADGIIEDTNGQQWLVLTPKQMTFLPVAVSDAMRFVVLHLHGGAYFDMDVLMLRDMRPLLLPRDHSFEERWAAHVHPGDHNTAVMSLTANSSLSSYLVRDGVRMGLNFHPRVIGRMAWKDGRDRELLMLETAAFDPIWTEFNRDREGRCTVPCLRDYGAAFKGKPGAIKDEWESYDGPQLQPGGLVPGVEAEPTLDEAKLNGFTGNTQNRMIAWNRSRREIRALRRRGVVPHGGSHEEVIVETMAEPLDSFTTTSEEEAKLREAGAVADYVLKEDEYPPNNRTLENFFRGAWTYHVHNQWLKHPEPSSWFDVLERAHGGFFACRRVNPYGEKWGGPDVVGYNKWPELV